MICRGQPADELIDALARFDPEGLANALGEDEEHAVWFRRICEAVLPDYMYSLEKRLNPDGSVSNVLPVYPLRQGVPITTARHCHVRRGGASFTTLIRSRAISVISDGIYEPAYYRHWRNL